MASIVFIFFSSLCPVRYRDQSTQVKLATSLDDAIPAVNITSFEVIVASYAADPS